MQDTSVPFSVTDLCSLLTRLGHWDHGSVNRIPILMPAPAIPGLSAPGASRSGGANSMGPRPSRPGGPRRKEAHCPPRNTFWGPREKAPVLNFRRKSPALAPHRERFVVPTISRASERRLLPKHLPGENPPWRADRAGFKPRELIKKILAAGAGPAQVSIDGSPSGAGGWGLGCGNKKGKNAADLCPEPPPGHSLVHPGPALRSSPRLP